MRKPSTPITPWPHFESTVERILMNRYQAPPGFLDIQCGHNTHRYRVGLHWRWMLTPEQSASELLPFLEAFKKPLMLSPSEEMRDLREMYSKYLDQSNYNSELEI